MACTLPNLISNADSSSDHRSPTPSLTPEGRSSPIDVEGHISYFRPPFGRRPSARSAQKKALELSLPSRSRTYSSNALGFKDHSPSGKKSSYDDIPTVEAGMLDEMERIPARPFDSDQTKVSLEKYSDFLSNSKFPEDVFFRLPEPEDRPSCPRSGEIALCIRAFDFDMPIPFPPFLIRLFHEVNLSPLQFHPNFFKFVIACHKFHCSQGSANGPSFLELGELVSSRFDGRVLSIRTRNPSLGPVRLETFHERQWWKKWIFIFRN